VIVWPSLAQVIDRLLYEISFGVGGFGMFAHAHLDQSGGRCSERAHQRHRPSPFAITGLTSVMIRASRRPVDFGANFGLERPRLHVALRAVPNK
jgi:hypothetical protein